MNIRTDISVIIPLLDEEDSVQELASWIVRVMEAGRYSYEIFFVDDGSSDGSWKIIESLAEKNHAVKAVRFRRNYGKSAALNVAFAQCSGEVVITMDADLQDSPDEIPALYRMIKEEGYDLVSGWKKIRHDPFSKTIPSKLFNWTTRKMSGIKNLHDFNCGLKAYRKDVVKNIEVYGEMHRYIPMLAKWAGYSKIGEKAVEHKPRKYGRSKFGIERFMNGYLDLLSISFIARFGKKPMYLFGFLGTFSFLAGFGIAIYLAYEKFVNHVYRMTERPLFFFGMLAMILGTQLFVAGFLGEMISRNAPDRNRYIVDRKLNITA